MMEYIGLVFAFGAALTWGLVYTVDQKILTELSPVTLLFIQAVVTVLVLAPFVFVQHEAFESVRSLSRPTMYFLFASLVLTVCANVLIFYSIQHLGASTAALLEITYPLFVVFFVLVLFGTAPNVYVLLGGGLILIGAMLVSYFA
jgi:drug/metabolite transporter (DMT)-like permease